MTLIDFAMIRRYTRKLERACCVTAKYTPLIFVYGLTTWGVWVVVKIGAYGTSSHWIGAPFCSSGIPKASKY